MTATNEHGEAKSVGSLSVILPRSGLGDDDKRKGGMPFPPGFIRQLKNKHVFTHLPTIFDCLVVGHPVSFLVNFFKYIEFAEKFLNNSKKLHKMCHVFFFAYFDVKKTRFR